jgi:hypothetical protein
MQLLQAGLPCCSSLAPALQHLPREQRHLLLLQGVGGMLQGQLLVAGDTWGGGQRLCITAASVEGQAGDGAAEALQALPHLRSTNSRRTRWVDVQASAALTLLEQVGRWIRVVGQLLHMAVRQTQWPCCLSGLLQLTKPHTILHVSSCCRHTGAGRYTHRVGQGSSGTPC